MAEFNPPHLHLALVQILPWSLASENESLGCYVVLLHTLMFSRFDTISVCYRQTDRHGVNIYRASIALRGRNGLHDVTTPLLGTFCCL